MYQGAQPGATAEVNFDPSQYPRTYSVSSRNRWTWSLVGLAVSIGYPIEVWRSHGLKSPMVLFVLFLVLVGGSLVLRALTFKLILEPDAVTLRYAFSSRRLLRYEIAGWTMSGRGTGITLILQGNAKKILPLPDIRTDPQFSAWFAGISEARTADIMDTPPNASILTSFLTFAFIMVAFIATVALLILLGGHPFQAQIVSLVADTEFIFLLVFVDTKSWRGYSLRNKQVQRELPRLLRIHFVFLVLIFVLLTFAFSAQPRLPSSWLVENGPRDGSWFAFGLIALGTVTAVGQATLYRRLLRRALEESAASPNA
jgi:hypothetical protein